MYSPDELARLMVEISVKKVYRKFSKVFVSAILAGFFVGLGYFASISINVTKHIGIEVSGMRGILSFVSAIVFAVGLVMILVAGADLFTGNCLVMFGVFNDEVRPKDAIINLLIVLLGNFIGAIILAFLIYIANPDNANIILEVKEIASKKLNKDYGTLIVLGILCNILVAIAVYMSYAAKSISGKVIVILLPIVAFIVMSFEHSVANMFILPLNALYQKQNILLMFENLIPVIIGNFIGGGLILPLSYTFLYVKE